MIHKRKKKSFKSKIRVAMLLILNLIMIVNIMNSAACQIRSNKPLKKNRTTGDFGTISLSKEFEFGNWGTCYYHQAQLYIVFGRDILIYDLRDIENPLKIGEINELPVFIPQEIVANKNYLFLHNRMSIYSRIEVFDISTPERPFWAGDYLGFQSLMGMIVLEDRLYACELGHEHSYPGGITVLDIQGGNPQEIGGYLSDDFQYRDFALYRKYAYAAGWLLGDECFFRIRQIDISKPTDLVLKKEYRFNFEALTGGVVISGEKLYCAAHKDGLLVFDISKPDKIKPAAQFKGFGDEVDTRLVAVSPPYIFIMNDHPQNRDYRKFVVLKEEKGGYSIHTEIPAAKIPREMRVANGLLFTLEGDSEIQQQIKKYSLEVKIYRISKMF